MIGSLVLPATTRNAWRRDLSVAIAAGAELGVRVVRTSGSGVSFPMRQIVVACEFDL